MRLGSLLVAATAAALHATTAAVAAGPADRAAWVAGIDYSVIDDPGRPVDADEERAHFRRYMVENLEAWSPGRVPFDIAVPAPFYRQDGRLFAFDLFPPAAGAAGWGEYAPTLTAIMGNAAEFAVAPDPGSFRLGRSGEVAWMSMQAVASGRLRDGTPISLPVRTSLVLERTGGRWLIVHEHVSTPFGAGAR